MKIPQNDDVELISIKRKSLQDFDSEINLNANKNYNGKSFSAETFKENDEFLSAGNMKQTVEEEENYDDHYESSVRCVAINKSPNGAYGFHITRTKWDPYPWINAVDDYTTAAESEIKVGDCVLEVNGCDVLGLRITEIAKLVKSSQNQVTLLLWSSNCNTDCDEESLCAAPIPRSLQRLSLVVQTVLTVIECPVCLDTITPPAMQCQNGHLLCVNCRIRAEKCPVCRDRYFPRPALIAEQIQSAITSAFNLCRNEDKVRQKIFGRHNRQRQMVRATLDGVHKFFTAADTLTRDVEATRASTATLSMQTTCNSDCDGNVTTTTTTSRDEFLICPRNNSQHGQGTTSNKFLAKLLNSKAYSMENLTNGHNNTATATVMATTTRGNIFNTCHATFTSAISQVELLEMQQHQRVIPKQVGEHRPLFKHCAPCQQIQQQNQTSSVTNTNQINDLPRSVTQNHHYMLTRDYKSKLRSIEYDLKINSKLCCMQLSSNKLKHLALSSDVDLRKTKDNITCLLESPRMQFMRDGNKFSPWPAIVCETPNATIPRAIRLKENHCYTKETEQ